MSEEVKNLKVVFEKIGGEKMRLLECLSVMERDMRWKDEMNIELSEKLGVVECEKVKIVEGKKEFGREFVELCFGVYIVE